MAALPVILLSLMNMNFERKFAFSGAIKAA